jgi:tetratricopeptide (TPR) repeat protein
MLTIRRANELRQEAKRLEERGELDRAEFLCRQAQEVFEREEGHGSLGLARVTHLLGTILEKRGSYEEALACARRALGIIEPILPIFADATAKVIYVDALGLEGTVLRQLGLYREALIPLELAIEMAEPNLLNAATAWIDLGLLCKSAGWFERGEKAFSRAMNFAVWAGEDGLSLRATILHNIGEILSARGDYAAAERPTREAWEIRRRIFGQDDLTTVAYSVAYAGVLDELKRYTESGPFYQRAVRVYEERLGAVHPHNPSAAGSL